MLRLSREQVRRIDRLAVERYRIPGIVLMENAARGAARAAWEMLGNSREVLIACGGGNNGGDGLAMARHLHNRGANVRIFLTADPEKYRDEAKVNWDIVTAMKLPAVRDISGGPRPGVIVVAIFGTGLATPPRPPFSQIVGQIHALNVPILAVDVPSGMDCDTGKPLGDACIRATRTVTFVAEKLGFGEPGAAEYLGKVEVADIGVPPELIDAVARGELDV
ncbi:MAG: NAD(P)H-hydrate epimerase [Tepidisphaeraceae bacterium]|jgi:NAD(P)H-hydrate epimerase